MSAENHIINLISFGFKHKEPPKADIIMDVRFLQNPHWVDDLREKTGTDEEVGQYIEQDPNFTDFIQNFMKLLLPLLPQYFNEERKELTIAIGCTGGHHRSVYTVEKLSEILQEGGATTRIAHRNIHH